jgi:hypothetical protein
METVPPHFGVRHGATTLNSPMNLPAMSCGKEAANGMWLVSFAAVA